MSSLALSLQESRLLQTCVSAKLHARLLMVLSTNKTLQSDFKSCDIGELYLGANRLTGSIPSILGTLRAIGEFSCSSVSCICVHSTSRHVFLTIALLLHTQANLLLRITGSMARSQQNLALWLTWVSSLYCYLHHPSSRSRVHFWATSMCGNHSTRCFTLEWQPPYGTDPCWNRSTDKHRWDSIPWWAIFLWRSLFYLSHYLCLNSGHCTEQQHIDWNYPSHLSQHDFSE